MKNWEQFRLGNYTSLISSGSTPRGGQAVYLKSGPVMLIRSQNVRMNQLDLSDVAYISNAIDAEMQRSVVAQNDVLLNITGASIGRVARFNVSNTRANVNQHVCIIRLKKEQLDSRYLTYYLSSPQVQHDINNRHQHGGTRQALTFQQIADFEIPLPYSDDPARSLREQKRIAAILDKADAIRRKRQEAIEALNTLTVSTYFNWFGHPASSDRTIPLGDCVSIISGGTPSKLNPDYWNGDFPWVSPKDMKVEYISDAEDHVSELAFKETTLKKIPKRSILVVVRGMILVHTVPIALTDALVTINQDMKALLPKKGYQPEYLCWTLKAAHNYLLSKVATAAHGTKRLEVEHLASAPVPLVSEERQSDFVRVARRIRETFSRLKSCESDAFFNSLVQRAFKGEL